MQEIVKEEPTPVADGLLSKAINAGAKAARAGMETYCTKEAVERAIEDRLTEVKRLIKRGRYAAADIVDDTAYYVKRDPFRAVAVTFSVGLGIGMLTGWFFTRNGKTQ